ncbi:MAG: MarR family transcriptional regulator [Bacteroidales bacterium]|nr:MarR family transcriptional regulator [Bacteroidales bacterium]
MKLNETIEFYIRTTSLALSRVYNSYAAEYGISQTIGYILTYVEKEGTPSTKLAQQLGMKNSSLTRLIKKMESDGCITRVIDEKDKRIIRVFLTSKGVQRRKLAKSKVLEFNEKIIGMVSKQDLDTFFKVFNVIKNQISKELESRKKFEELITEE